MRLIRIRPRTSPSAFIAVQKAYKPVMRVQKKMTPSPGRQSPLGFVFQQMDVLLKENELNNDDDTSYETLRYSYCDHVGRKMGEGFQSVRGEQKKQSFSLFDFQLSDRQRFLRNVLDYVVGTWHFLINRSCLGGAD